MNRGTLLNQTLVRWDVLMAGYPQTGREMKKIGKSRGFYNLGKYMEFYLVGLIFGVAENIMTETCAIPEH